MNVDVKCEFAELKYQQLLYDKYFIDSCFSKKFDSYSIKDKLQDIMFYMKDEDKLACISDGLECLT